MDRHVTPPKRVTSPSWSPAPPCKLDFLEITGPICFNVVTQINHVGIKPIPNKLKTKKYFTF